MIRSDVQTKIGQLEDRYVLTAEELGSGSYAVVKLGYSKDKKKIKKAAEEFFVGNLYLNRKCTGALVGVHPFGGYNMSGTCSKAGGFDYLLLFMQTKITAEKIY